MTLAFTAVTAIVEVQVINFSGGPNLVEAIEIISPANKDRQATRDAFVTKCAGCLQEGIGLIVIDIVTQRNADLHDQILSRVSVLGEPWDADLYAVSYHPVQQEAKKRGRAQEVLEKSLEIWPPELKVGSALATLPMCLNRGRVFAARSGSDLHADLPGVAHSSQRPIITSSANDAPSVRRRPERRPESEWYSPS